MGTLDGKVAIVTGAGGGIGAASARRMAAEGASVVVADLNLAAASSVANGLERAVAVEVDVSDEGSVVRMIGVAADVFGRLDVLHNNATDSAMNAVDLDIVTLDMKVFDRLIAVNLKGVVMGCKHAIPLMLEGGGGSIVNTWASRDPLQRGRAGAHADSGRRRHDRGADRNSRVLRGTQVGVKHSTAALTARLRNSSLTCNPCTRPDVPTRPAMAAVRKPGSQPSAIVNQERRGAGAERGPARSGPRIRAIDRLSPTPKSAPASTRTTEAA
jgi:NAD(P)-dependent dehydrogenase (short-subunit alcohol dehydrogenase family)